MLVDGTNGTVVAVLGVGDRVVDAGGWSVGDLDGEADGELVGEWVGE